MTVVNTLADNAKALRNFERLVVVRVQSPAGKLETLDDAQACFAAPKALLALDLKALPAHSLLRRCIAAAWVARGVPVTLDHGAGRIDTFGFGGSVPQPPAHFSMWVYTSQAMYDQVEAQFLALGKPARHRQPSGGSAYSAPYFAIVE